MKQELDKPNKEIISGQLLDYILWLYDLPSRQESFAEYICKFLPISCSILEVGCGRTGIMSRILKEKGYKVSCMDPEIDPLYLKCINSFQEKFHYETTNIEEYDYLIAQTPCDATEHIVRACVSKKKPFIMSLCSMPHNLINGDMLSSAQEWYSYLQNISSNLKLSYKKLDPFTVTPILKSSF